MIMDGFDAVIIGGGPAGLAAAAALSDCGVEGIAVIEREDRLGGILRQCIHDGFGTERFGESLTGPEYAARLIAAVKARPVRCFTGTSVLSIGKDLAVTASGENGIMCFHPKAVILASGCRERSRGAIAIPGERPSGVMTAGTAQAYINLYNRLPGHEAVILGSGDIGLIMARRLTLEGVKVHGVFEIQDHPNGLERNVMQCLEDYSIPLHLRHTVTDIHGTGRLEGVTVAEVDACGCPIPGTEKDYRCDTLILSVGLIPDTGLLTPLGAVLDSAGNVETDEHFMTSIPGIFAAGNCLHVHDLADDAAAEAERLASAAARYIRGDALPSCPVSVIAGNGVRGPVPCRLSGKEDAVISFRPSIRGRHMRISVKAGGHEIASRSVVRIMPQNMLSVKLLAASVPDDAREVEVSII